MAKEHDIAREMRIFLSHFPKLTDYARHLEDIGDHQDLSAQVANLRREHKEALDKVESAKKEVQEIISAARKTADEAIHVSRQYIAQAIVDKDVELKKMQENARAQLVVYDEKLEAKKKELAAISEQYLDLSQKSEKLKEFMARLNLTFGQNDSVYHATK